MVDQRRGRRAAGNSGPFRSSRDKLVLMGCVLGLLIAWLVYGGSAVGNPTPIKAGSQAGTLLAGQAAEVPAWAIPSADSVAGEPEPAPVAAGGEPAPPGAARGTPAAQPGSSFPAASPPRRITYPAAGMDVVVHPLEPSSGDTQTQSIVPPETMDGYWLTPFGTPGAGSTNTTYVIGHSWDGLDAPFNHLSSAATAGDEFSVTTAGGSIAYRVESVTTYTKATLKDSPIWAVVPNRLVLISCYTEDPWGKNVTVVASPVPDR